MSTGFQDILAGFPVDDWGGLTLRAGRCLPILFAAEHQGHATGDAGHRKHSKSVGIRDLPVAAGAFGRS